MYMDGVIVAKHHIIAAVGVDAQRNKHVLSLAPSSSDNDKVVKDLLSGLALRGLDLNVSRLWVIDGSKAQHSDAAASVLAGLDEMFTITELGITGKLGRCRATTNVIESPNSVVRGVSARVTNCKDGEVALRWAAAGFFEAEKSFKKLRSHADLKTLISGLRSNAQQLKKAASYS